MRYLISAVIFAVGIVILGNLPADASTHCVCVDWGNGMITCTCN